MFAAPRRIVQTMPIQSALVSGRGNRIIPRWDGDQIKIKMNADHHNAN
jgi:hypothetical protein